MKWLLVLALSLFADLASASYSVHLGTASYFGRLHFGLGYYTSAHHEVGFGLGFTQDASAGRIRQLNLWYGYTPYVIRHDEWVLRPMSFGISLVSTGHEEFFFTSPDKYHDKAYYDPISRRYLLRYGMAVGRILERGDVLFLKLNVAFLDQGVLTLFNNGWTPAVHAFISPGISLVYDF